MLSEFIALSYMYTIWNASVPASPLQPPTAIQAIVLGHLLIRCYFFDFSY